MKKLLIISLTTLILTGCLFDEQIETKHLTKDFNLAWGAEKRYQALYLNSDHNEYGGFTIIPETVYAIGFDEEFIIAKQHPNLQEGIGNRLFGNHEKGGDYLLTNPADTIYLSREDSIYEKNGKWYHISNGWDPPSDLFPYKDSTYYYIIDIRNYGNIRAWDREGVYKFDTQSGFENKRIELGVSADLDYTFVNKELE